MFIVIMLGFAVVTAIAAAARGRSPLAWFFIGLLTGIFGLIAVLVMERQDGPTSNDARPLRFGGDDTKNY